MPSSVDQPSSRKTQENVFQGGTADKDLVGVDAPAGKTLLGVIGVFGVEKDPIGENLGPAGQPVQFEDRIVTSVFAESKLYDFPGRVLFDQLPG